MDIGATDKPHRRATKHLQELSADGQTTSDLGKSQAFVNGADLPLSQKEFTLPLPPAQSEGITQKSEEL